MRVQGAPSVVRHQNFHLTFGQILDMFVKRACFGGRNVDRPACLLISFICEELPSLHGQVATRDTMFGRSPQKIARRLFVAGSQSDGRVWGGGNILFEPPADVH
jgi:hypothetical protein